MQLEIPIPTIKSNIKTQISSTIYPGPGTTSIPVYDSNGFQSGNFIILGTPSTNGCEMLTIATVPTSEVIATTSGTFSTHTVGDNIQYVLANEFQIFRSTTGVNGTFSLIATIPIVWNQTSTNYFDGTFQSGYAYQYALFNSTSGWLSPYSAILPGAGYAYSSRFNIRSKVRTILKDPQLYQFSDAELNGYIDDIYTEMQQVLLRVNPTYNNKLSQVFNFVNGQQEYPLPSDFREVGYVLTSPDGVTYYSGIPLKRKEVFDIQYNNFIFNPNPTGLVYTMYYYINTNSLGFFPIPQVGSFKLWYTPLGVQFQSDSDVMMSPLSDYIYVAVNGVLSLAYRKGGNTDLERMQSYAELYEAQMEKMLGDLLIRNSQDENMMSSTDKGWIEPFTRDLLGGTTL